MASTRLVHVDPAFRPATEADSDVLADTILGDARQESAGAGIALFGVADPERLRALFRAAWCSAQHWRRTETRARLERAAVMALHTLVTNPARRLYERHGYAAVLGACDPTFERITGVPGNVLHVKDLRQRHEASHGLGHPLPSPPIRPEHVSGDGVPTRRPRRLR
jgi:hypothetical protein